MFAMMVLPSCRIYKYSIERTRKETEKKSTARSCALPSENVSSKEKKKRTKRERVNDQSPSQLRVGARRRLTMPKRVQLYLACKYRFLEAHFRSLSRYHEPPVFSVNYTLPRCHGVAQMPQLPAGFVNFMDLIKGARTNPIEQFLFFPFVYYAMREGDSLESDHQIKRHLQSTNESCQPGNLSSSRAWE